MSTVTFKEREIRRLREAVRRALVYESYRDLAARIGIAEGTLHNFAHGIGDPNPSTLRAIRDWDAAEGASEAADDTP